MCKRGALRQFQERSFLPEEDPKEVSNCSEMWVMRAAKPTQLHQATMSTATKEY